MELSRSAIKRRAKAFVRDTLATSMHRLGVTRPDRRAAGRLTIVTFHRVLPDALRNRYPYPNLAVTPEELDWFLSYFRRWFRVGSMVESLAHFRAGNPGGELPLAVTFDDGQRDNYEYARPVLARHGVHATFYIPVEAVQRSELIWHDRLGFALLDALNGKPAARAELPELLAPLGEAGRRALALSQPVAVLDAAAMAAKQIGAHEREALIERLRGRAGNAPAPAWADLMSFDEIRQLRADGHEIGSHSLTHPFMVRCTDAELERELQESRRILEAELGSSIASFCYPDGNCDARTERAAERAGYDNAVTTRWGNNPANAPQYALRRHDMSNKHALASDGEFSDALLAWRMSGLQPGLR